MTEQNQERRILHDLRHSLKLMPASQRELFASEVARYVAAERQAAVEEGRQQELQDLIRDSQNRRREWQYPLQVMLERQNARLAELIKHKETP